MIELLIPKTEKSWITLGLFCLLTYVLSLSAFIQDLDKNQLFTALASGVIGSGFGLAIGYHFATTKGNTEQREIIRQLSQNQNQGSGTNISVETPADIKVTTPDEQSN